MNIDNGIIGIKYDGPGAGTWTKRVKASVAHSRAELIVGLYSLSYYMPTTFVQNLFIEKICVQEYSKEFCLAGMTNQTIEQSIQGTVSQYLLYYYLMQQLPAVVLALFMGHWSDVYGRKFIMNLSVFGNILSFVLILLCAYFTECGPMMIIVSSIPVGLTGGYAVFMMGLFGYIRDVNSKDSLSMRISLANGSEMLALEIGPLIGSQLFARYGYPAVFSICIAFLIFNAMCIGLFVDENDFKKADLSTMVKDFFNFKGFTSCLESVWKRRKGNRRLYIALVMFTAMLIMIPSNGRSEILYLFARLKFQWDVVMMTYYNMVIGGSNAIGLLVLMPILIKFCHLTDTTLSIFGQMAYAAYYISIAFVSTTTAMFSACLFNIITTMSVVTNRSLISKCVSRSEVGKVMAVFAVLQALYINLGQIIASQVYARTYLVFPGTIFVCFGSFLSVGIAIYIWIHWDLKKKNQTLEEENEDCGR